VRRLIWTFFSKEKGIGGGGARVISSTGRERWGGVVFCAAIVCGDQSDNSKEEYVIRRHLANMATDLTLENTRFFWKNKIYLRSIDDSVALILRAPPIKPSLRR
jgi:hypothetical protein